MNPRKKSYYQTREYLSRQKNLAELANNFDDFISVNEIYTIVDIPFNKFNQILIDSESTYLEFIRNPDGKEIYVILKLPGAAGFERINSYKTRSLVSEDPISLLVCVIKGIYCYLPTVLSYEHEYGQRTLDRQIFSAGFGEYNIGELTYGDTITFEILTFESNTGDLLPYWMYIFNDANYANILSVVKDKFILSFMYKIAKFQIRFSRKKDYNFVWKVISDKFSSFAR